MTQEEFEEFVDRKWSGYSNGLRMAVASREDKHYSMKDVRDAFETGFYEMQQILIKNNIDIKTLKNE